MPLIFTSELHENDVPEIETILESRVIDSETQKSLDGEIGSIIIDVRESISEANHSTKFIICRETNDQVLGIVGMQGISRNNQGMLDYVTGENPIELVHLFAKQNSGISGVGTGLVETLLKTVSGRGHDEILLNSGPRYEKAWPFYDKVFGPSVGKIENMYGAGRHAPVWRKILEKESKVA